MSKTLGQIAHEAGESAGGWARKWADITEGERAVWEQLAQSVAVRIQAFTLDRAALVCRTLAYEARDGGRLFEADGMRECAADLSRRARGA